VSAKPTALKISLGLLSPHLADGGAAHGLGCFGVEGGGGFLGLIGFFLGVPMPKTPAQKREDEVLLRMLKIPPKPHAAMKTKKAPSPGKAKAKKG